MFGGLYSGERQDSGMAVIRRAELPIDSAAVIDIWRELVDNSPVNLACQNNEVDFATFANKYAAPYGCVLLAEENGMVGGSFVMRQVTATTCEMKLVYVRPAARGKRLGRELAEQLIAEARHAGCCDMRLDVQSPLPDVDGAAAVKILTAASALACVSGPLIENDLTALCLDFDTTNKAVALERQLVRNCKAAFDIA
jgi:GNAT superfamily N-acetyltransferase